MKIKSKIHSYGHEHESEWPPKYPQKSKRFIGYWDKETQAFKEGYPPQVEKYGRAPQVIFDSIKKRYHEPSGLYVESRKEWESLDEATGSLTFSTLEEANRHAAKGRLREEQEYKQDRKQAAIKANQAYKENPKAVKDKVEKQAEKQREIAEKSGLSELIRGNI